ncbi:unnamed protein product [Rotaria sp. Silwood2]|nr:unnamed protein product [Rotaria sp. Silwood2]CAF4117237.1 unnamed protein product [Rotaria sp. Silwood2]
MAGRSVPAESGASNDNELIDSGLSSNDTLTNVTNIDDTLSTLSYPSSTISIRSNSMSETISGSVTMDCSTLVSNLTSISSNISMVSIRDSSTTNLTSCESYTGPYVLTKDYDDEYVSPYSIMSSCPTTGPEHMFPPYQRIFSDDDDFRQNSKSKFVLNMSYRSYTGRRSYNCDDDLHRSYF